MLCRRLASCAFVRRICRPTDANAVAADVDRVASMRPFGISLKTLFDYGHGGQPSSMLKAAIFLHKEVSHLLMCAFGPASHALAPHPPRSLREAAGEAPGRPPVTPSPSARRVLVHPIVRRHPLHPAAVRQRDGGRIYSNSSAHFGPPRKRPSSRRLCDSTSQNRAGGHPRHRLAAFLGQVLHRAHRTSDAHR
jgi:hypothetical protein